MCFKMFTYLLIAAIAVTAGDVIQTSNSNKLIIDNDAGGDDAVAIFLAILYEKHFNGPQLIGLTTGNGNTCEENVFINNQKILKIANRQDIPIYRGSKSSLVITPKTNDWFGADGLGDTGDVYDDLIPAQETKAVDALIELSKKHKGELTIITLGSLTNIALAIKLDPGFLERLSHLYVAAGHIHEMNPALFNETEFNAFMDVEAYSIVVKNANPDKVTLVPFSQIMTYLNISKEWRLDTFGAIDNDIVRALNKFEKVSLNITNQWHALDPAAVAAVLKPEVVSKYDFSVTDIVICGDDRGTVTNKFVDKKDSNVRQVYSFDIEKYKQFLLDVFSAEKNVNK